MVRRAASRTIRDPRQLPMFIPQSDWKPLEPSEWPDFHASEFIGVDTEGHDPKLETEGPGYIRGDAFMVGFSLADESGRKLYLPINHVEGNVDKEQALRYLRAQMKHKATKVGANLMYDLEACWSEGVDIEGTLADIQVAGPLLDEDRPGGYSLDQLSLQYLGKGKTEDLLKEAENVYGFESKKGMHYLPPKFVGPYAEADAIDPIRILEFQLEELDDQNLTHIWEVESELTRVLFEMRLKGVRVDLDEASRLSKQIIATEDQLYKHMRDEIGQNFSPLSSQNIGRYLEKRGHYVPRTKPSKTYPNGQFSVSVDFLKTLTHDQFAQDLAQWRTINKMRNDFIDGGILEKNVKGRLYSNWHQLREFDENGKKAKGGRGGRIMASKFNLTQIPRRDPIWGPAIRKCFLADMGKTFWKSDYSQQEPRGLLHFAVVANAPGAQDALKKYLENPNIDYHQMVADLCTEKSGKLVIREQAKPINLGLAYGMGEEKLALTLGISIEEARSLLQIYHQGVPYVKYLERKAMDRAEARGFVTTILGRKRRFNMWEPRYFNKVKAGIPTFAVRDLEKAYELWGRDNVRMAFAHKALNAVIQGTAADQTKTALILMHREKLTPQIQVYDEINGSYDSPEQVRKVKHIMEHAIEMKVPFLVKPEYGPSWGETQKYDFARAA